jgi:hypothetical protein
MARVMVSRTRSLLSEALSEGPIRRNADRSQSPEFARLLEQQVAKESGAASTKQAASPAPPAATSPAVTVQTVKPAVVAQTPATPAVVVTQARAASAAVPVETEVETASTATVTEMAQTVAEKAETASTSNAPQVVLSNEPGLEGAARNPFFGFAEGKIANYKNWFQVDQGCTHARGSIMPYGLAATAEGAAEALRLVQQFEPGATMREVQLPGQAEYGHGASAYLIDLPSGRNLNAGLVLEMYYMEGRGCSRNSEAMLRNEVLPGQAS